MKTLRRSLIYFWLLALAPALAGAQVTGDENDNSSIFDYLIEEEYTEAVITTDLAKLLADRQGETEYQPANLLLTSESGQMMSCYWISGYGHKQQPLIRRPSRWFEN